jgi:hypothetical protein
LHTTVNQAVDDYDGGKENARCFAKSWEGRSRTPIGTDRATLGSRTGTTFVKSSPFSTLSSSVRSEAKPFGSWILVSNVEREAAERELVEAGTLVSADSLIEASAFGCDSKVLER